MKKISKRILSAVFVAVMFFTAVPFNFFAIKAEAAAYKAGDTFYLGTYPQDKVTSITQRAVLGEITPDSDNNIWYQGKKYKRSTISGSTQFYEYRPIKWRVLSVGGDGIFAVADQVIDCQRYNQSYTSVTWATCTLRTWLNTTFYNKAFSTSEKSNIRTSTLINDDCFGTEGGNDTKDKIFLLSYYDVTAKDYGFSSDTSRVAYSTDYAKDMGAYYDNSSGGSFWLLRSPGCFGDDASIVHFYGLVSYEDVNYSNIGIRPALKLNLSSSISTSKSEVSYSLRVVDEDTGSPISGANVTLNGLSMPTDSDGMVTIAAASNASSSDTIQITANGYDDKATYLYQLNPYSQNTIEMCTSLGGEIEFEDLELGGETITGPTVNILGESFSLFKFNSKISIPLSDITKLNVSTEEDKKNKTKKYILGVNPGYSLDTDAKRSEDYKNFKDFYQSLSRGVSNQETLNKYNKLRSLLKDDDGSLGFSCGLQFAGYLEYDYSSGKNILVGGGIIVIAEASVSTDVPFAYICYATFKIGGEIKGDLSIKQNNSGVLAFSTKISLSVKPTIGVGLKILCKDLASIEVGIDGKITGSVKIPASSFKNAFEAYLSANCYVKAKTLFIFEKKWSTNFPNLELYPNFGEFQTNSLDGEYITIDDSSQPIVEIKKDDLELIDRSYLDIMHTSSVTEDGYLNESAVYPYGYPQIIELDDGTLIATYLYDDGTKSDINRTTLYYSVYSGGKWSNPAPVNNSGRADFPAKLCTDGTNVYAVWQRASEELSDSYTVEDVVDKTELVCATFNGSTWSSPVTVDTADKYQVNYEIAANNGDVALVWCENSENDYTLNNGTTTIYTKSFTSDTWSEESVIISTSGVTDTAIGFTNDVAQIAYIVDGDGDLDTLDDNEVYIDNNQVTDNSTDECEITFQNGKFYWNDRDDLKYYNGIDVISTGLKIENDYRVVSNADTSAVTFLQSDGFKNELMVSYSDGIGGYTQPVALTDYGRHIGYYDAELTADGKMAVLADVDNLSGDDDYPYTTTDMVCNIIEGETDVEIADVTYSGDVTRGSDVTFMGTVKNLGTTIVDTHTVAVKNSAGETLRNAVIRTPLQPGESAEFSLEFTIPEDFNKENVTVSVTADGDSNSANNSEVFTIGHADIVLADSSIARDGTLTVLVSNNGCETANNTRVKVFNGETLLTTLDAGNLAAGESKMLTYQVPTEYIQFDEPYNIKKFSFEAISEAEEVNVANNETEVTLAPLSPESVVLSQSVINMEVGETAQLQATVYPANADNKAVSWVSDAINVATVDSEGNITPVAPGKATITAITNDGGLIAQCEVNVTVKVKSVEITEENITINAGDAVQLNANINPTDAVNKNVTWTSSDTSIATVSASGIVTGVKTGNTIITVKTEDGGFEASCNVAVTNIVKGISISDTNISMYLGKTKQLTATVIPADADNQAIKWTTSDEDIVTVSGNGLITAVSNGTATVTATSEMGGYTAECVVTVGKHATSIVMSDTEVELIPGFSTQLTATVLPFSALVRDVTWYSTNTRVATVDDYGNVTAHEAGTATIMAYCEDGDLTTECIVTVTNSVAAFELSKDEIYISRNSSEKLTGVFTPETAENKNIVWKSSNPQIASVDENGVVTGHLAGAAMITATTEEGGYIDYCSVMVVGLEALYTANVDYETKIITGLSINMSDLGGYITLTDSTCSLEYESIGTDSIVYLTRDDEIIDAYTILIFGDVNGDGWYDGQDAVIVSCLANGMLTENVVGKAAYMAADCNHDGIIDENDVNLLNEAGSLLSKVDQTKPTEELLQTESYIAYASLIEQDVVLEEDTTPEEEVSDEDIADDVVEDVENTTDTEFDIITFIENIIKEIIVFIQRIFNINLLAN